MPELPEVETIVRELRKKIIGLKITDFWSDREKPVKQAGGASKFLKEIKNKKIVSVSRRAKYIVIDIEGDKTIFIHQKISGHLMYGRWKQKSQIPIAKLQKNSKPQIRNSKQIWVSAITGPLRNDRVNQYIRYIWFLSNGYQLAMSDLRRFSRIILIKDKDISNLKEIRKLGPEPLDINFSEFRSLFGISGGLTFKNIKKTRNNRKRGEIKKVLMDPFFIVGIGNIYSDEILWDAGFHPKSRVEKMKEKDIKKIYDSMLKILKLAIRNEGDSMDDYRLPSGEKGNYQNIQKAYQETGNRCKKNDEGIIKRIVVGGRSAHFCNKHQRLIK